MMRRAWMATGALLGWFALVLQFYLTIPLSMATGRSFSRSVVFYFSFFTILTNLWTALQLSLPLCLPRSILGRWFSQPAVQAASAVYIVVVGIVYSLLLRHIWNPQGWQKLADVLLHDVVPLLYAGYWLLFAPKRDLRWRHAAWWLAYPVVYVAYTIVRGAVTGWYPYPFCDAGLLGYPRALLNTGLMLVGFFAMGLFVVAVGRRVDRRSA